jgi:hypothetical protein
MKRLISLLLVLMPALLLAEESWLGIYMQGAKIGHAHYRAADEERNGQKVRRNDSTSVMHMKMLGQELLVEIKSVSWSDSAGQLIESRHTIDSAGRTSNIRAMYHRDRIEVEVENGGQVDKRTLPLKEDMRILDDPFAPFLEGGTTLTAGNRLEFYVLDPMTTSLSRTVATVKGPAKVTVKDVEFDATLVELQDPRATMKAFISSKGDLIKVEGPMGLEMIPLSREEALGQSEEVPTADLALSSSIKPDRPLPEHEPLRRLRLRLTGENVPPLPIDKHQTARRDAEGWLLSVHPVPLTTARSVTIAEARAAQATWIQPSLYIPAESARFKSLAKEIVGAEQNALAASLLIKNYVYRQMKPNAGIGVLRGAEEVLTSREGVCRDYAILAATLMRAAGVPTKVISGLTYGQGSFFYHAWVEVWDGANWIGLDPTVAEDRLSATRIKLSEGNVEEAFVFPLLERVGINVLSYERYQSK